MSSMLRHSPPWNEYVVSHHTQRSGQPVRRTNTVRQPIASASPWIEWKISVMRRRSAGATGAPPASLPITLPSADRRLQLQSAQAFLRQAGGAGVGILAGHLL